MLTSTCESLNRVAAFGRHAMMTQTFLPDVPLEPPCFLFLFFFFFFNFVLLLIFFVLSFATRRRLRLREDSSENKSVRIWRSNTNGKNRTTSLEAALLQKVSTRDEYIRARAHCYRLIKIEIIRFGTFKKRNSFFLLRPHD